jgi:hypothetical protein
MPHFECGAFDHSATSPGAMTGSKALWSGRVLGEVGRADKARGAKFPLSTASNRGLEALSVLIESEPGSNLLF